MASISVKSLPVESSSSLDSLLCFVAVTTVTIIFCFGFGESSSNGGNGACFVELMFSSTGNNFFVAASGLGGFLTGVLDKDAKDSIYS